MLLRRAQNNSFTMKTIVVTGATKGIGRAICQKFAKSGFNIGLCARNEKDLEEFSKELTKLGAGKVYYESCDVSQKTALKEFAEHLKQEFTEINVLVNNAGVYLPGTIAGEEEGALEQMIETNLYSAYHLTRLLLPAIKGSDAPYIFNMCSTASIYAYENGGSYCISKFALLGMTKVLRQELKETVKVSAILPGPTLTASWDGVDLPASRFMQAEEVAEVVWTAYHLKGSAVVEEIVMRPQLGDI